ncbi:MAG: peroxiredoxin family protein [Bacteroidota bacterium]
MKKLIFTIVVLSLAVMTALSQDLKIEVGQKIPEWVLPDANGEPHSMDTWEGKVLQINYVDPDEEAMNDHFNDEVDKATDVDKRIDKDYFKGFGIVDSKSTWKPNPVIRLIAKRKEKKYGTTILFDYDGLLHEKWGAPMDSYTIVIADKDRICRAVYQGRIPEDEVEDIIQLIIKLTKE